MKTRGNGLISSESGLQTDATHDIRSLVNTENNQNKVITIEKIRAKCKNFILTLDCFVGRDVRCALPASKSYSRRE